MSRAPTCVRSLWLPSLLVLLPACAGETDSDRRFDKVLLAVVDAAHAAHFSCYGNEHETTRAVDELAAGGVRFSRAFSNNTWTLASTASLMTGQLQEVHGAVTNGHRLPDAAVTLAELFSAAGYETAAFVQMAYASATYGLDQGFHEFTYYGEAVKGRAGQTIPDIGRWLEAHADEPWFVYLHLRRPHSPYRPNEKARGAFEAGCSLADGSRDEELEFADLFKQRELPPEELAHVRHLYQGNLLTADYLLLSVLARARAQSALVVLTSDHGEALGQHGVFGHGTALWAESIDVPLIFWWPAAEPRVDDGPACTVDVLPTLLELCSIEPPARLDGRSLVARLEGRAETNRPPVFVSARYNPLSEPMIGVVDGPWKLVEDPALGAELFHRLDDPKDERDRSAEEPEVTARLAALARAWRAEHAGAATRGEPAREIDPALEADLDALGY